MEVLVCSFYGEKKTTKNSAFPCSFLLKLLAKFCFIISLNLNYEFFSPSHSLSLSNLAYTHHIAWMWFFLNSPVANILQNSRNIFQILALFHLSALPAQLLCLSFCNIVFTWLPWCPVPKILFAFFCLLLSCLFWLLCLFPTSRRSSVSDLNSGSFSFSYHIVLLGYLTHSSVFYRPCVRKNIAFFPISFLMCSRFIIQAFMWYAHWGTGTL